MSDSAELKTIRCAIYTRKSTEGAHDAKLTSCESQRQACEQWAGQRKDVAVIPTRYDDFGYSAGTMDRPAFQKLLADVHAGIIDAVLVYDFDRLSRSTKDFPVIRELLRDKGVQSFSVSENYDGMAAHYRDLMLNLKMSIAEFQRTDAAARVTQKLTLMAAKGMRVCGSPVLGYDIKAKAWIVNEAEAKEAVELFRIYRKTQSLSATARAANEKGLLTKRWTTAKGIVKGGKPYSKNTIHHLLRNPVYVGKIRWGGKVSDGLHPGIVPPELFAEVQEILTENNEGHDSLHTGQADLWLKGKLRCAVCGSAMTPTWTISKGKRYAYYECGKSRNLGKKFCSVRRVSAEQMHDVVLQRMAFAGKHAPLIKDCLDKAAKTAKGDGAVIETELKRVMRELSRVEQEGQNLAESIAQGAWLKDNAFVQKKLAEVTERRNDLAASKAKLEQDNVSRSTALPTFAAFQSTLRRFPEAMASIEPSERKDLADLLIREVIYDEAHSAVTTTIFPLLDLPETIIPARFRKASKASGRVGN